MVCCNAVVPQVLWFKRVRVSPAWLLPISSSINVGMWFERFVIIVTSLHRSYLPSSWVMYTPTPIEIGTLIGSFRPVLHLLPVLHPAGADDCDLGGERPGRHARRRIPPRA